MTRIEEAKKGTISNELKEAAHAENMDPEVMRSLVADGSIVLVRNKKRGIKPLVLGRNCSVKVNANIGTSPAKAMLSEEIEKCEIAVKYGADALMDLSTGGALSDIRKNIIGNCPVAIGTVPIYEIIANAGMEKKELSSITPDDMFNTIEAHCEQGVDFLTLHCGVNRQTVNRFKEVKRAGGAVSRGGTIMMDWIEKTGNESPLYEQFDRLLDILAEYDVAASLGDGFRPGAIEDSTDRVQVEELTVLGELVRRARKRNVGVFVEGPGHVPLNQIETNVQLEKRLCENAPFYVLGPLVTDVSPGYDHISGAIGGAVAGMAGADFLCYVTPAEHLRLPSIQDVREGVIASRIAAHAADLARGCPGAESWDREISKAKVNLEWDKIISLCIDPDKAREYRASLPSDKDDNECSMCGEFCAIKRSKTIH